MDGGGTSYNNDYFRGGNGGIGGKGGKIKVDEESNVYAFNGSYLTEVDSSSQTESWRQNNQCCIYAQVGYSIEQLRNDLKTVQIFPVTNSTTGNTTYTDIKVSKISKINARNSINLIQELGNNYRSIDNYYDVYGIGIGSGAGYIEVSNGTYAVDSSMN